jgi:hypothetical protein
VDGVFLLTGDGVIFVLGDGIGDAKGTITGVREVVGALEFEV